MDNPPLEELPPGYEQPDRTDRLISFLAAIVFAGVFSCSSSGVLHPGSWADAAVAAGLRPPDAMFPNLGRILLAGVFSVLDVTTGLLAANILGALCGGMAAACFYMTLRELLPAVLSLRSPSRFWAWRVERVVAMLGTAAFMCSGPVFRMFLSFSGDTVLFVLVVLFARLFLRLLHFGRFSTAYACLFILGVLSAETPFGLVLTLFALVATLVARRYAWRPDLRYFNPMLVELSKWRLTLFFALGFACTALADGAFFVGRGGTAVAGLANSELPVEWIRHYGHEFWRSATWLGWIMVAVFVMVPLGVAAFCARRATDDDLFLPYRMGILFIVLFLVSLLPLSALPYAKFWAWTFRPAVNSPLLLALSCFALALTFTLSMAVFAYDIWCRDHRRIVLQRFPELVEDGVFLRRHFHWRWRRLITVVALMLIAAAAMPLHDILRTRRMSAFLRDVLRETAAECGDAKIMVTDGSLDDVLRLAFAATGRRALPLSIMAGRTPYERNLRLAAAENDEDRATLALGVSDALRNWVAYHPERLYDIAIQVGFELWRNDRSKRPPISGLLASARLSAEDAAKGARVAQELAQRAIDIHSCGAYKKSDDRLLKEKFLVAQWRLARMAALRDENAGAAGDIAEAHREAAIAEKLDELNPELQRLNDAVSWIRSRDGNSLTPREGLRIALERADFELARRYATPILSADSTHPDANFGMGMSYFVDGQYAQAEKYLKVALESRPNEPALLNNLAICYYRQSRYEEALAYADKALAKLPDAPAVRKTYEQIRKTIDEAKNPASGAK